MTPKPEKDVLSTAAESAKLENSQTIALQKWLIEQLAAHEYAKLGQGGHTQNQVPLRQVFVDLPVTRNRDARAQSRRRFLVHLLNAEPTSLKNFFRKQVSSEPLNDDANLEEHEAPNAERWRQAGDFSASLLIGGPGQGKSTLGQLACQLHRAALLKPFSPLLTASQRELIASFDSQGSGDTSNANIAVPSKPLLPLQVSLPDFAAWLSKRQNSTSGGPKPAILSFLAQLPSAKGAGVTDATLRAVCSVMPCLIVLDGFDEVGAAQDRDQLVKCARDLLAFLAGHDVHVQIIATTRPQGYTGEFSKIGIPLSQKYLAPLNRHEALGYAQKLVFAKIPDPDLRTKTLDRLREAAAEESTRRLLTTPLQVTILTALVQQIGRAPRERWNLFSRYFSYTYDREIERETYASRLLAEHRSHIEQIHSRVALLLQVEAERDGGAAARMPKDRLEEVIEAVLAEDEVEPRERADLVKEILIAAEQRLVFLVEPEPGAFGFEIRSLQEFMAAWAITSGRDADIESRMLAVAKASMFRNVTLFAASRLYSEGSPIRDAIPDDICGELDNDGVDELARTIFAGAQLALDILEEGAALSQPKRARLLMKRAAMLLDLPANEDHVRLARVANNDTGPVLAEAVEAYFQKYQRDSKLQVNAGWLCLLEALNSGAQWADRLATEYLPLLQNSEATLEACAGHDLLYGPWAREKICAGELVFPPASFVDDQMFAGERPTLPIWAEWLARVYTGGRWRRMRGVGGIGKLIQSKAKAITTIPSFDDAPSSWIPWLLAARFEVEQTKDSLVRALAAIAEQVPTEKWHEFEWRSSWPLAACLAAAANGAELLNYAEGIKEGKFGTPGLWLDVQSSWQTGPLNIEAVLNQSCAIVPWTIAQLRSAPPIGAMSHWALFRHKYRLTATKKHECITLATSALAKSLPSRLRYRFGLLATNFLRALPQKYLFGQFIDPSFLIDNPEITASLLPRPASIDRESWIKLLDKAPNDTQFKWFHITPSEALSAMLDADLHPITTRYAVMSLDTVVRRFEPMPSLSDATRQVFRSSLEKRKSASGQELVHLAILKVWLLSEEDGLDTISAIEKVAAGDGTLWMAYILAVRSSSLSVTRKSHLALQAYDRILPTDRRKGDAARHLKEIFQIRKSGLEEAASWDRLALPLPYPLQPTTSDSGEMFVASPVHLASVDLRDIKGIAQLSLSFSLPPSDHGQWTVLIGPNGSGKTTILRSIALALRNARDPSIWPKGAFGSSWIRSPKDMEDHPSLEAKIGILLSDGNQRVTTMRSGATLTIHQTPEFDHRRLFPVFAYGCRRGSALGGASREVDLGADDGPEIATLFDDRADLIHAETWLLQLDGDASKNQRSKNILDAVLQALREFLNISCIEIYDKRVWVTEHNRPRLPFSSLSDGYLTSAGWFVDLVARWIDMAGENFSPQAEFLGSMCGLVLIDEIDLHLHPKWQVEIISKTRTLLPRMSFVVTTHNPLTLVGSKAEEVWILQRKNGVISATTGIESPVSLTGGQLYRRYFGIDDIYPNDLGRAIQRYSFLSNYELRDDGEQAELESLQKLLLDTNLLPSWEVVPRKLI